MVMEPPGHAPFRRTGVLVIGAGMSGLLAACELAAAGAEVLVVDKARGPGGRMATRRLGEASLDHGAQFFTAHTRRFRDALRSWQEQGLVEPWIGLPGTSRQDRVRWRGRPAMTAIPKHLARDLDLLVEHRVTALEHRGEAWLASLHDGSVIEAQAVLLTAPLPQALDLVSTSGFRMSDIHSQLLARVGYEPCLAVLAQLDGPSDVPTPGWVEPTEGPLASVADNHQKGVSRLSALTLHATAQWSDEHFDCDVEWIASELLKAASPWLGSQVSQYQVHRWRYSKSMSPLRLACLQISSHPPLVLAGDAFGGPRVEGAALSGWAAAEVLLGTLMKD